MTSILYILALILVLIFFGIQLFSLWSIITVEKKARPQVTDFPKIAILLAARNEEELIIRSLTSIANLDYPQDKLEVLIGNDKSEDRTEELITEFIEGRENFKLFNIEHTLGKGRGKANVLAHLAHKADGEFYFITDVDVKLPSGWLKEIVAAFEPNVGIVSGTTKCERGNLFASLQAMDWLHFMGYIKAFANVGIGCTSVGNNMAVRAKAYWETGGYEKIDFSITEDYKLFSEVTANGWEWRTILTPNSLGLAWYIPSLTEMLHQRKRWLIGAKELPLNWKSMIVLYGLFIPALLFLFYIDISLGMSIWLLKFFIQSFFIYMLALKVNRKPFSLSMMLMYEVYVIANTFATALFYFLPVKSIWKGRIYNKEYIKDATDVS